MHTRKGGVKITNVTVDRFQFIIQFEIEYYEYSYLDHFSRGASSNICTNY